VYDTVQEARNYVVINPRVFAETVTWTHGLRDKLRRRQSIHNRAKSYVFSQALYVGKGLA